MARRLFAIALASLWTASARAQSCPQGTAVHRTDDPFVPVACAEPSRTDWSGFETFRLPGVLRVDFPRGWRVIDAWKDDVPALYIEPRVPADGRPVVLTIARYPRRSALRRLIRRERDWSGARDAGTETVDGGRARLLDVPGRSATAFVDAPDGAYVLAYSAPDGRFEEFRPAFARLLETFRTGPEAR